MKPKSKITTALLLLSLPCLISCGKKDALSVTVTNGHEAEIGPRIVELSAPEVLGKLGSDGFYITDNNGNEIPSQLTYDSLILFKAEVPPGQSHEFLIHPCDTLRHYKPVAAGQKYPKRRDDVSYENELVGFRIYGPGTMLAGEKAYGYDIFFKHPTEELIVPQLYAPETDDSVWAKVDSLRAIDPVLADEFINSFSYHIDHGLGMDCYAVGPTLGDGVAALLYNDTIYYPWCYETAEILDNGPLRFTLALDFAPITVGDNNQVAEHRIISLDSESHLNKTKVWYDGLKGKYDIVAGFPLRDDSTPLKDIKKGYVAYSDPTQGDNNGRALLGLTMDYPDLEVKSADNHILMGRKFAPGDTLDYNWGFAWDKADIPTLEDWGNYLEKSGLNYIVTIK